MELAAMLSMLSPKEMASGLVEIGKAMLVQ
jgi:hypothetical protein